MEKESTSFWADIKKYEDTLVRDPKSYCFAPLSELYRKLGLLDDAIGTAKKGVQIHPEYIGGYMALGRAYFEKGMRQEARESLEKVARATPENLLAQRLLSQIYQEERNFSAAEHALRILISFNSEDTESRLALESLERIAISSEGLEPASESGSAFHGDDLMEMVPDDGLEHDPGHSSVLDVPYDAAPFAEEETDEFLEFDEWEEVPGTDTDGADSGKAPLATATLAELYEAQGYCDRALEVYEDLLLADPENHDLQQRADAMRQRVNEASVVVLPGAARDKTDNLSWADPLETIAYPGTSGSELAEGPFSDTGCEDEIVRTLENWLDSIRRVRACRSGEH